MKMSFGCKNCVKNLTLFFLPVLCDLCRVAAVRTPNLEENLPPSGPSLSSFQRATTTVTMATHQPVHKSRSGLEEMESEGKMSFIAYWKKKQFHFKYHFLKFQPSMSGKAMRLEWSFPLGYYLLCSSQRSQMRMKRMRTQRNQWKKRVKKTWQKHLKHPRRSLHTASFLHLLSGFNATRGWVWESMKTHAATHL